MDDPHLRAGGARGPVQLLLIGIDRLGSEEMIAAEVQDLRTQTAIQIVDLLRVRRGLDGGVRKLTPTDPPEFSGRLIEALLYERPADPPYRPTDPTGAEGRWSSPNGSRAAPPSPSS